MDLDALADNYKRLQGLAEPSRCAAVVKADAYGLGVAAVSARLAAEGCETFFVATAQEAIQLRLLLPQVEIGVFEGVPEGAEALFLSHRLLPVVNTLAELERWGSSVPGARAPTILHIDTGMTRLGLDGADVRTLAGRNALLEQLDLRYVMTHLACADEPAHPLTEQQIARFAQLRALLPGAPTSIGNSAGVLRGVETRGDLSRPGIALYGGQALADAAFIPVPVVRWQGRVLQVRRITEATSVGYGAAYQVQPPAVVATVAIGYADGYRRALGGSGSVGIGAQQVPVIGRVSMDLISIDVSDCDVAEVYVGAWVDLIGGSVELDAVAAAAGTISYELLTGLGSRAERIYKGDVRKTDPDQEAAFDG
ncbi:MAG: alanine racemase [Gammaproteobacteria bacterium]|nr:alanine racemase [Gammaproteobacteria bacterium]